MVAPRTSRACDAESTDKRRAYRGSCAGRLDYQQQLRRTDTTAEAGTADLRGPHFIDEAGRGHAYAFTRTRRAITAAGARTASIESAAPSRSARGRSGCCATVAFAGGRRCETDATINDGRTDIAGTYLVQIESSVDQKYGFGFVDRRAHQVDTCRAGIQRVPEVTIGPVVRAPSGTKTRTNCANRSSGHTRQHARGRARPK